MEDIKKRAVAISPTYNEPMYLLHRLKVEMRMVGIGLRKRGVELSHFFLSDGNAAAKGGLALLVDHKTNQGLSQTLVDGYTSLTECTSPPDIIVRLDSQEHDPRLITDALELLDNGNCQAVFLPVWYLVKGQPRPSMLEIYRQLSEFGNALSPVRKEIVLATYNQRFPFGFQVFRLELLREMLPLLKRGMEVFKELTGRPATWGLDLLSILLAAKLGRVDILFGGFAKPWAENRSPEKIREQRERAAKMLEVFEKIT